MPKQRKCYFTKTIIEMDSEDFNLLNEQIEKYEEKNKKSHHHKRNDYNPFLEKNFLLGGINNKKFMDLDYEENNNLNFFTNLDISKLNNSKNNLNNKGYLYSHIRNKNRLESANILKNRYITKNLRNKNNYYKKLTDIPLSPYILNKYNFIKKPLNKSNSALNLFNRSNRKPNYKFPNFTNNFNSLKSIHTNKYVPNTPSDNTLNYFKTNDIFDSNQKINCFIPIMKKNSLRELKSANIRKFQNNNCIDIETTSPFSVNTPNKINLDMINLHNAKKFHFSDKGFGKHFGSEKDCPVCQSISMKSNYNMKKFHNYHNFIKERDKSTIEKNKKKFLYDLKIPNSRSHRMEAEIIREIKQFIKFSKKEENNSSNKINDASLINAYFEV